MPAQYQARTQVEEQHIALIVRLATFVPRLSIQIDRHVALGPILPEVRHLVLIAQVPEYAFLQALALTALQVLMCLLHRGVILAILAQKDIIAQVIVLIQFPALLLEHIQM